MLTTATITLLAAAMQPQPPIVVVDRDNVEITESCRVRVTKGAISDADGNGVVHIATNGIEVTFEGNPLLGAEPGVPPDEFTGYGVRVTAQSVKLRGLTARGFKAGIWATKTDRIVIEDCDLSDNFRQRLGSTPWAEDPADWLRPHENDDNEWLEKYGAGLYVEDARHVTIRRVRAWHTQNGIILDRVLNGSIYDNDCSFGSGWGLAMWRCQKVTVSRNAFDFRIRGYSHGVYNRGQDSAGILMFEQCVDNQVLQNSATHGGDGIFAFSGREALGEVDVRPTDDWYRNRGNTSNVFAENDCSFAAAHGIEVTFGHGNHIVRNKLVENAICGIWGGYSNGSYIAENIIERNGDMPYGTERGGINIEHGHGNYIVYNRFLENPLGISLWWDEDETLMALPWAQVNRTAVESNLLGANTFVRDLVAVRLRECGPNTMVQNVMTDVGTEVDADTRSLRALAKADVEVGRLDDRAGEIFGETRPIGGRQPLWGRQHIIMTEWGPYDWQSSWLHREVREPARHLFRVLGPDPVLDADIVGEGLTLLRDESKLGVVLADEGVAVPYEVTAYTRSGAVHQAGVMLRPEWEIVTFPSLVDPREDADAWRTDGLANGRKRTADTLELRYANDGPDGVDQTDHFGTIATTTVKLLPGTYRLATQSDDGIRVWLDDELVIDDWTWHPPKRHLHELTVDEARDVTVRVEHFELDGYAVCVFELDGSPPPHPGAHKGDPEHPE